MTGENKKPAEKKTEKEKLNDEKKDDQAKEPTQEKEDEDSPASEIAQTIRDRRLKLELNKQEMEKKMAEERERYDFFHPFTSFLRICLTVS